MAFSRTAADHAAGAGVGTGMPLTAHLRRVSWGAVIAGVVIALAAQALLAMLGIGIGLATIEPTQAGDNPAASSMGIGAAIWWALSGIIAAFLGGWVAARLAGMPSREASMLHGLATWAATTLVVLYFLGSTASSIVGGALNAAGQTLSSIGSAASGAASTAANAAGQLGNPLEDIANQVRAAVNPNDAQAAGQQLASAVRRMLTSEGEALNQARQSAVDLMVRQGVPQEEAQRRIADWERQYRETRDQVAQQARTAADAAADGASTAAFYAFIALLLGAIAGAFGGRAGTPPLETAVAETGRVGVS